VRLAYISYQITLDDLVLLYCKECTAYDQKLMDRISQRPQQKKVGKKLENLLDTSGSRMMLLPDLQSFCPRVTLTFDLLTPKVGGFTPLPVDYTCGN